MRFSATSHGHVSASKLQKLFRTLKHMIFLFCVHDKKVAVPDLLRLTFYNSEASSRIRCGCDVNLLEFSWQASFHKQHCCSYPARPPCTWIYQCFSSSPCLPSLITSLSFLALVSCISATFAEFALCSISKLHLPSLHLYIVHAKLDYCNSLF